MTLTSESTDQDLVVLLNKVQATVIGDKSCDLLAILDQLHTNALSMDGKGGLITDQLVSINIMTLSQEKSVPDSRVRLLGLDSNLLENNSLQNGHNQNHRQGLLSPE